MVQSVYILYQYMYYWEELFPFSKFLTEILLEFLARLENIIPKETIFLIKTKI